VYTRWRRDNLRSTTRRGLKFAPVILALAVVAAGCGDDDDTSGSATGRVVVSGSSTVLPISERVAELLEDTGSSIRVDVDGPGTGDGFKLFCNGETDISGASRPIKGEEAETCSDNGVEYIELKVAFDGLAVMTNPTNDEVECLSNEDMYALVGPESQGFGKWSDAQPLAAELGSDIELPDARLEITAPGDESGTYDSFVELVIAPIGEERAEEGFIDEDEAEQSRPDYSTQSDDNVIMQAMEGSNAPFGWVGFAYAQEAGDAVKFIEVRNDDGDCVAASDETIADRSYPLSRALYIYVNVASLEANPAVAEYVDYYVGDGTEAVSQVGYVALPEEQLAETRDVWAARETGSRDGAS
jgi:phosphate transport system substrate-binding protein